MLPKLSLLKVRDDILPVLQETGAVFISVCCPCPPQNVLDLRVSHPPQLQRGETGPPQLPALHHYLFHLLAGLLRLLLPLLSLPRAGPELVLDVLQPAQGTGDGWGGGHTTDGDVEEEDNECRGDHIKSGVAGSGHASGLPVWRILI